MGVPRVTWVVDGMWVVCRGTMQMCWTGWAGVIAEPCPPLKNNNPWRALRVLEPGIACAKNSVLLTSAPLQGLRDVSVLPDGVFCFGGSKACPVPSELQPKAEPFHAPHPTPSHTSIPHTSTDSFARPTPPTYPAPPRTHHSLHTNL